MKYWFLIVNFVCFFAVSLLAQEPLDCDGTVYCIIEPTNEFGRVFINPANNSVSLIPINSLGALDIHAIGYRSTDQLIYGVGRTDHRLYRIDALGDVEDLGPLALGNNLVYEAAGVTPNGEFLYTTGSLNGIDQHLARVNLNDFSVTILPVAGNINLLDIAFHPYTGDMWAYDFNNQSFLSLNLGTLMFTGYNVTLFENKIQGVYIDASGKIYGYGTSAFGVAGAIFDLPPETGQENRRITGPVGIITDLAGCPYGLEVLADAAPKTLFPCEELEFTYLVGNGTGGDLPGVDFEHNFPAGFNVQSIVRNPYGGTVTGIGSDFLQIDNMSISPEIDSIVVLVELDDIAGGQYKSQAKLTGLPVALGGTRLSDDFKTFAPGDSTFVNVNRIEEDSIFRSFFSCIGNELDLDASEFGANIEWNTGSSDQVITVNTEGLYYLNVGGGCQEVYVEFDVTYASCPYTIEVRHETEPRQALPCSEAVYHFYIENSSGFPRNDITFIDTLPLGFTPVEILQNPYGGALVNTGNPQLIKITGMNIPVGTDTLDILVEVGDLPPGEYPNQARIEGFPAELGPFRLSDDPNTQAVDSTIIFVLGVPTDSFYVDTIICARAELDLNAAPFGFNYLWDNGSTDSIRTITQPGDYNVTILDGCDPSYVFFTVTEGTPIDLFVEDEVMVFLGESYQFLPSVINLGDSLLVEWVAEVDSTLSCLDCLSPLARPLITTVYTLKVSNGTCTDSSLIDFVVDNTRRVFAPNIFSANRDGINDWFYLQSPDYGVIRNLRIYSRWGSIIYSSTNSELNFEQTGWNGKADNNGKFLEPGVYLWQAEIEFLDGLTETLSGDVMLIR
ncbi:MAG: gliding motility-associated C-terminal domain-containing protein [Lewinella sp.]|uniref:T9SS type B sorting domain-containing protein n=1 Tax=Lewinella sp. TaxID=2004506 RepID=UPI003D6A0270